MVEKKFFIGIFMCIYLISVNCEQKVLYLQCDPAKVSAEKPHNECPENAQCVEIGKSEVIAEVGGLCACKVNYTVNRSYLSTDAKSQYCIVSNKTQASTTITPLPLQSSTAQPIVKNTTAKPSQPPSVTLNKTTTQPPTETLNKTILQPSTETLNKTIAPSSRKENTSQATNKKIDQPSEESNESSSKIKNDTIDDKRSEKQQQSHHIFGGIILPIMVVLAFIGAVLGIRRYNVLDRAQNYIRNRRNGQAHQTRYDGLENDFDDDPLLI